MSSLGSLQSLKERAQRLDQDRSRIEAEISSISARLTAPGEPGVSESLLDKDGFPRADINIPKVRADRHRLAVLNTDYKRLSSELEEAIVAVHEASRQARAGGAAGASIDGGRGGHPVAPGAGSRKGDSSDPATATVEASTSRARDQEPTAEPMNTVPDEAGPPMTSLGRRPFAVIDEVTEGSPAELDGIKVGDYLVAFGDVSADINGNCTTAVAAELQGRKGGQVQVQVLRAGELQSLTVVPRDWAGRGLLGCHMAPL